METHPHAQAWLRLFHRFGLGHECNGVSRELALPKERGSGLAWPQAKRSAAGFCLLPRFTGLYKGRIAAASCISKLDYTALFLCFLPSFPWRSRKNVPVPARLCLFPQKQRMVGKPSMRGQAPLGHHQHVIFSWAFHPLGSSAGEMGSAPPSLQGGCRNPYSNVLRSSLKTRFRGSVAV